MNTEIKVDNYVPYGPEWEAEINKFPKKHLVQWIGKLLQERPAWEVFASDCLPKKDAVIAIRADENSAWHRVVFDDDFCWHYAKAGYQFFEIP